MQKTFSGFFFFNVGVMSFLQKIWDWIKEHPFLSICVILAGSYAILRRRLSKETPKEKPLPPEPALEPVPSIPLPSVSTQRTTTSLLPSSNNTLTKAPEPESLADLFSASFLAASKDPQNLFTSPFATPTKSSPENDLANFFSPEAFVSFLTPSKDPQNPFFSLTKDTDTTITKPIEPIFEGPEKPFEIHPLPKFNTVGVVKSNHIDLTSDQFSGKWVVLFFYFKNVACQDKIINFQKKYSQIPVPNENILLIGCSRDSKFSHESLNERLDVPLDFPLIADTSGDIFKLFDIKLTDHPKRFKSQTFIISPTGVVVERISSIDATHIFESLQVHINLKVETETEPRATEPVVAVAEPIALEEIKSEQITKELETVSENTENGPGEVVIETKAPEDIEQIESEPATKEHTAIPSDSELRPEDEVD